ncbi:hypothetical protein DL764_008127 [Monosporascus ibericus]|uniref:FAD linked oxidase N-terminal domain-containing protein n=1 Tax=Monosporascus ibericus TaxID=155417 RepID=A0A4Q4T1M6_9PEZI|nr:hypothetical protein DL764_008127 [Monosporascus ibericus]
MCRTPSFVATTQGAGISNGLALTASAGEARKLHETFGAHISAAVRIFLPSDPSYATEITQRWTTWEAPSQIGTIKPATEKDVATIVKLCVENDIPFLATGGGHGAGTGYGKVKGALNIDLGNFRRKELPTGRSPCVGLVGLTFGGGIGTLQGRCSLIMDALVSVRMVTARGKIVVVSEIRKPGFFWALRGAGGNFGVVTSSTYRVFEATNKGKFLNADFEYAGCSSRVMWELIKAFDDDMPAELSVLVGAGPLEDA